MPTLPTMRPLARAFMLQRAFRARYIGAMGLALSMPVMSAYAQEIEFNIPAQPLASALQTLGRQANVQVLFNPADLQGIRSTAVSGKLDTTQAIERLLSGTGISYQLQDGTLTLTPSSSLDLSAITVKGSLPATTEGTDSYTTGSMSTATKLPLSMRETPQSTSVITRKQIDDQGLTTVTDAVMKAPGLSMQKVGSERYSFFSRGFPIDSIMYDGLPSRLAESADVLTPANLAMYDRVEVVRGANGLVQGSGNPSAAINLVRKRPTYTPQGSVSLSAGSWDNYRSELDVSGPLNDSKTLRGRTVISYQDQNSFRDNVEKEHSLIYATGEADLTENTTLSIGFSHQNENNNVAWGGGLPTGPDGKDLHLSRSKSFLADWEYWDKKTDMLFVDLTHRFENDWQLRLAANRSWSEMDYLGGYPGRKSSNLSVDYYRVSAGEYKDTQSSYDLYLSGPFEAMGRTHEFVVGYSRRKDEYDSNGAGIKDIAVITNPGSFDSNTLVRPTLDMNTWQDTRDMTQDGLYATTRLSVTDDLKFILGGRLDWYEYQYDYTFFGVPDPTTEAKETRHLTRYAGVLYDLDQHHTLYASYTDIFQPQGNRDIDNKLLEAIEGKNYEIGIKGEYFDGAMNASLAIFQIDQENRATEVKDPTQCASWQSGMTCYESAGKVRSQGFEAEINGALTSNWQLAAGYTFAQAKYKKDKNKDNEGRIFDTDIPRHQFKLTTMYHLTGDLDRWRVGGGLYYQSSIFNKGTTAKVNWKTEQDSYGLVDLYAGYKASEQLDVRFALNNVFDKKYYQTIGQNVSSWPTTFYGAPRNFLISTTYKFW